MTALSAPSLRCHTRVPTLFGVPKYSRCPLRIGLCGAALALSVLTGCAGPADSTTDERPLVLTTFTVLADLARNVAGEHLRVESITKIGAEIHGYEPTPSDIVRASGADLVLENGLNLEAWFAQFVESAEVPHVVVSDGIRVIDIAGDAYAGKPNPHAWMSPLNAALYVATMAEAFSELAPEHAADFASNAAGYTAELLAVQAELEAALSTLPANQRALVTCEGAFSYLARDAGLTERYIWPVNAEQQATPRQIADTIEFVRDNEVPAVFCESTVSDRAMQQVVDATDAVFGGILYVDSLSEPDGPVATYLDLIRYDTAVIIAGLTGSIR